MALTDHTRAGRSFAISFCDYEKKINLADIHKLIAKKIAVVKDHPYNALMHPREQTVSQPSYVNKRKSIGGSKWKNIQPKGLSCFLMGTKIKIITWFLKSTFA